MSSPTNRRRCNLDIQLLYDIIRIAESSDLPPFRALFTAYDRILRDYGIERDHDQVYFRFLLRLGETRGDSLFERFETLLQRLGFEIRFDGDVAATHDKSLYDNGHGDQGASSHHYAGQAEAEDTTQPPRLSRRASFDSGHDTKDDVRRAEFDGSNNARPRPHSTDTIQSMHNRQAQQAQRARPLHIPSPIRLKTSAAPSRGRLRQRALVYGTGHTTKKVSISRSRTYRSLSSQPRTDRVEEEDEQYDSGSHDDFDDGDGLAHTPYPRAPPARTAPPRHEAAHDLAALEANAKALRYGHAIAHAIAIFRDWRQQAIACHNVHHRLYQNAANHDTLTLVRQAYDQWRDAFSRRRQEREENRFFQVLEDRAGKARDFFLLNKAFTHWHAAAEEQVIRSDAARRHILRARYFRAWRDLAMTNERKVRYTRLSKFVDVWKRKTAQALSLGRRSEVMREANLVSQHYRQWFWHFCENRAPTWYATKVKTALFARWLDSTRQAQVQAAWATDFKNLELVRAATADWSRKSTVVSRHHETAELFRRRMLLEPNIDLLKTELALSPLLTRMIRVVDSRVARDALKAWTVRARASLQAIQVSRLRVMTSTWTLWNDRLRCRIMAKTIDDRIMTQVLYKWVLSERARLFQRIRDEKLMASVCRIWSGRMNKLCTNLGRARYLAAQAQKQRIVQTSATVWASRCREQLALTDQAEAVLQGKRLSLALHAWKARHAAIEQLDTWANDARFFVLTSRSLKHWRVSTVSSQRNKRRDAYAAVRRTVKVAIARRAFQKWHIRMLQCAALKDQAEQRAYQRVLLILPDLLHRWTDRTGLNHEYDSMAVDFHVRSTIASALSTIILRWNSVNSLLARANNARVFAIEDIGVSCLRKLSWAAFQAKSREETAASLAARTQQKHYRGILRYWRDSMERRRKPVGRLLFHSMVGSSGIDEVPLTQAMNFDDDLIEFSTLTPAVANTPAMPLSRRNRSASRASFLRTLVQSARGPSQTNPQIRVELQPQVAVAAPEPVTATPGYLRTPSRRSALRNATGRPDVSMNRLEQLRRTAPSFAPSESDQDSRSETSLLDATILQDVSTTPIGLPPSQQLATKEFTRTPLFGRHRRSGFGMRPADMVGTTAARASRFAVSRRFSNISDVDEIEEIEDGEDHDGLAHQESPGRSGAFAVPSQHV